MNELFNQYLEEGKVSEALLVGQNLFNRNIDNREVFDKYFALILSLIVDENVVDNERFIQQATAVLAYYAENAELTAEIIDDIKRKEKEIDNAKKNFLKMKISENDEVLEVLVKLLKRLNTQNDKKKFEDTLNQIGQVDSLVKDEYLTENQKSLYDSMTSQCSQIVNKKMNEYNCQERVEYNLKAVQAYENVFNYFKGKTVVENHNEIIKSLFDFDASKLFNETLVYYNHVYNYVLSKLDDEEKFTVTKYAILSEKKR